MIDHPPLNDLLDRASAPDVIEHVQSCPSCRARARLLGGLEVDAVDPDSLPGIEEARHRLDLARRAGSRSLSRSLLDAEVDESEPHDLEPGRDLGRYLVEARLGRGGMGTVYRVRHARLGSHHALKVLHRTSSSVRERLEREGRAQSRLRHPNIVAVTDIVDVDGSPGLIMEWVDGPSLHDRLRGEPLTLDACDRLGQQIIRAVGAAHEAGIVHRDLKPANVLLAPTDEGFVAKVADFGLARAVGDDSALTRPNMTLGTPAYMAPEQIRDAASADERSDIFSLGAVLYELITGRRAFDGPDVADVFDRVRAGLYDPLPGAVPERMHIAVQRALAVAPEARFRSCAELLDAWRGGAVAPPMREAATTFADEGPSSGREWPWRWIAAALGLLALSGLAILAARPPAPPDGPIPAGPTLIERRLTARPNELQTYDVALSPDGSEMVFSDGRGLFRQLVDGGTERQVLPDGRFHSVNFFPDGKRLLVAGYVRDELGAWAVDLETGDVELRFGRTGLALRLSPDGTRAVVADSAGLWIVDVASGDAQRLRPLAAGDATAAIAWSPSGDFVAAVHHTSSGNRSWLEVTAVDGSATRRLLEDGGLEVLSLAALDWVLPDTLLYGLSAEDRTELYALDDASVARSADAARVLHAWSGFNVLRLRSTADGRRTLYSRGATRPSAHVLSLADPEQRRTLTHDDWGELPLGWRGNDTVLLSSERGGGGVYAQRLDGSSPELVLDVPYVRALGQQGPDLSYVASSSKHDMSRWLVGGRVVDGRSTETFRTAPSIEPDEAPHTRYRARCAGLRCMLSAHTGDRIVFDWVGEDPHDEPVLTLDVDSRMMVWDLSADAERLVIATSRPQRLIVHHVLDHSTVRSQSPVEWAQDVGWGHDGQAIYVSGLNLDDERPYQLIEVSPDGTPRLLWSAMSAIFFDAHASPDGTHLAVGVLELDDDTWLVQGLLDR